MSFTYQEGHKKHRGRKECNKSSSRDWYNYHTSCWYVCLLIPIPALSTVHSSRIWISSCSFLDNLSAYVEYIEVKMLNWVELNLTDLKLIKSMLTKCVHQKEVTMLFDIHFLPALFYLLDLLFFVYIRMRSISQTPSSFSSTNFHLLLLLYFILPEKSYFP